jgi:hypothetical protein
MPCQHYTEALIEAACSGGELQSELRAHLAVCSDCLSTFEQERSLFASIDAGLRVTANADMPASLLTSVRARLEESDPRGMWVANWLVFASAAVMVVAFFAARAVWHPSVTEKPVETTAKVDAKPSQSRNPGVAPAMENNSPSQRQLTIAKIHQLHEAPRSIETMRTMPEVLVPRDQEVLLAEYAKEWRLHKRAPLVAQGFDATVLAPLQVAQIRIDELDVKLLADDKSQ